MVRDLFINTTILITFVSIASQIIRDNENMDKHPMVYKLSLGSITGVLGILLMLFAVRVDDSVLLDLRHIPIVMTAVFGGVIPTIVCSAFIAVFRIVYYGVNTASILAFLSAILICIGCIAIQKLKTKASLKWFYSSLFVVIISTVIIFILLRNDPDWLKILFLYQVANIIVFLVAYYYVSYCLESNKAYKRFKDASSKDFLTGLNNVREFDKLYNLIINNALEKNENLSILMVDIDFFKKVNDTYGHNEGDIVLKTLSNILTKSCRNFDVVSRNGGEEFSVILLDCPQDQALKIAERIRSNVEKNSFELSNGLTINITISIGVVSYPESTKEIVNILKQSDEALYEAKHTGRNKVCIYRSGYNNCYSET